MWCWAMIHWKSTRTKTDTLGRLTNHACFNLAGQTSAPVLEQEIAIQAQYYTPTDASSIPLGVLKAVEGPRWTCVPLHPSGHTLTRRFSSWSGAEATTILIRWKENWGSCATQPGHAL